jgi:hypothetical protein
MRGCLETRNPPVVGEIWDGKSIIFHRITAGIQNKIFDANLKLRECFSPFLLALGHEI